MKIKWKMILHVAIFVLVLRTLHFFIVSNSGPLMTSLDNHELQSERYEIQTITKQEPTGMWTINAIGRLGNLMGEYATLYALAKRNGHKAYVMPQMYSQLSKIFKITLSMFEPESFIRDDWKDYPLHDWMSPEYKDINYDYVRFIGYPCSWTFYEDVKNEILREFTFHDYIKEEANNYLSRLQEGRRIVTFVGVHVRRGDYLTIMPNIWKGVVADKQYLQTAMDYFRKKYQNPLFIVTSNGMDWCKENINTTLGDVHFSGDSEESSPTHDFALLAHCNHTIMTIGTFGYWAGYLARGETIYLSNYTLPESDFLKVFKYEAAFLPDWIGIPADLSPLLHQTVDLTKNKTL
ncbi:galactoside alpha-(1,2)-fucosyltransferase 2-like [Rhinoderma darwinii]|uniref:galactoside alpha-(1,2)-fucosyltransferase 2-like n=1 Tax=Rhinoderma darwinii TaxID=43563 RepID=UPI003F667A87